MKKEKVIKALENNFAKKEIIVNYILISYDRYEIDSDNYLFLYHFNKIVALVKLSEINEIY